MLIVHAPIRRGHGRFVVAWQVAEHLLATSHAELLPNPGLQAKGGFSAANYGFDQEEEEEEPETESEDEVSRRRRAGGQCCRSANCPSVCACMWFRLFVTIHTDMYQSQEAPQTCIPSSSSCMISWHAPLHPRLQSEVDIDIEAELGIELPKSDDEAEESDDDDEEEEQEQPAAQGDAQQQAEQAAKALQQQMSKKASRGG